MNKVNHYHVSIIFLTWLNFEGGPHVFKGLVKRTAYVYITNHFDKGFIISHAAASMLTWMDDKWNENEERSL